MSLNVNCFLCRNKIYKGDNAPQFFATIMDKMETLDTHKLSTTLDAFLLRFECIVIELELGLILQLCTIALCAEIT